MNQSTAEQSHELFLTGSSDPGPMDPMQDVNSPASTTISVNDSMDFDAFFTASATETMAPKSSTSYSNLSSGDQLARDGEAGDNTTPSIPDSGHLNSLQSNSVSDDLAELEAWLLSGEIQVVPTLPW